MVQVLISELSFGTKVMLVIHFRGFIWLNLYHNSEYPSVLYEFWGYREAEHGQRKNTSAYLLTK